jgi:hypothetical protein
MVALQQFVEGVKKYVQSGVIPHMPKDRQFLAGVALGVAANKADSMVQRLKEIQVVKMLGLIDGDMLDDDALFAAMRDQMQRQGSLSIDIPWLGNMTFGAQDIDALQRSVQGR